MFFFFFVEFEEEPDVDLPQGSQVVEEDPYAWGKTNQQQATAPAPATAQQVAQPAAAPQPSYPGWKWDPESNQWIPDQ